MEFFGLGVGMALWLGIMTSISPCPLATNIAAISFVGRDIGSQKKVILSGVLYTLGRMVIYAGIGALAVQGLLSVPSVSFFLQRHMNTVLGPILIITGLFLLEFLTLPSRGSSLWEGLQSRVRKMGTMGSFVLGAAFALSFCPVSAALFFGSLVPLAVKNESAFLLPSLYGIGTGIPVIVFAFIAATSAQQLGKWFNKVGVIERWSRRVTGVVFILGGCYLTLHYALGVL